MNFHVIIPARYDSKRFPGKLMRDLAGQTIIQRVYHQVLQTQAKSIVIATDSSKIAEHVSNFNAEVIMTSSQHASGTDRIAEVIRQGHYAADDIIVNVQGDEPFIPP